jgi:hypothetical protein
MTPKRYLAIFISILLIVFKVDSSAHVIPWTSWPLDLNGLSLPEPKEADANNLLEAAPGQYNARVTGDSLIMEDEPSGRTRNGTPIITGLYKWKVLINPANNTRFEERNKKPRYEINKGKFYNVTQFSLFNFQLSDPDLRMFNSLATINGYQFAPGFCLGLGLMYNNYNLTTHENYNAPNVIKNVSFLPIYADIRIHLPQRGRNVAFFFKFDIGYNIVLTKKANFYSTTDPYNGITYSYLDQVTNGGILVSPGIGFRIFISELLQIIPSIELSFEKSQMLEKNFSDGNLTMQDMYDDNMAFFKINLGIALQY